MSMNGDEIVVGITGNSEGLVAASAQGAASLAELQAALMALADSAKVVSAGLTTSGGAFVSAGESTRGYTEEVSAAREAQATMAEEMSRGGGLITVMGNLGASVSDGASQFKTLLETMAGLWVIQEAIGLFDQLADSVKNAFQQIFALNVQTERNEFMWQYQYSNNGKPNPKLAQQIANWSYSYAYNAPFTRQDIMTGIGSLAPMGLNLQGLQFLAPVISDIASTHTNVFTGGNSSLTFSQVALAIMEAVTTGQSRRLLYETQIRPRDLEQFGIKFAGHGAIGGQIENPWDVPQALMKLDQAKGWAGAAQAAAHQTFWGEKSSFIDRIQNEMLQFGGMNPDASVRQGSMFGSIKQDMEDISSWFDAHQSDLANLANMLGDKGIGGSLKLARDMAVGFLQGLNQSGLGGDMLQQFLKASQWLADPNHQQQIKAFAEALGRDTGQNLHDIGTGLQDIADGMQSFQDALGPDGAKTMVDGIGKIGDAFKVLGFILGGDLDILADMVKMVGDLKNGDFGKAAQDAAQFSADLVYYQSLGLVKLPNTTPTGTGANSANAANPAAGNGPATNYIRNNKTGAITQVNGPYDKNNYTPVGPTVANTSASSLGAAPAGYEWVRDAQGHLSMMPMQAAAMMSRTYTPLPGLGNASTRVGPTSPGAYNQQIAQLQQAEAQMSTVTKNNMTSTSKSLSQQATSAAQSAAQAFHNATVSAGWATWGADAISLFAKGMKAQLPALNAAAIAAADVIHQVLGFSKPSRGPLADADKYMPDFITLLVSGLNAGGPRLQAAADNAAGILAGVSITGGPTIHGGATTVHFHGLPEPVMQRQMKKATALANQHAAALMKAPGSFRVFGTLGG